jgi:hypothetical protein
LGDKLIYDIAEPTVAGYMNARLKEGAAAASINREVGYLARSLGLDRATSLGPLVSTGIPPGRI